jgi:hypothetical protein
MKKILFLFAVCLINPLIGQDIISLIDGGTIESKVQEVTRKDVVYKKFSNQNGPNYHIDLNEVEKVTYESGAVDVFNAKEESESSKYSYSNSELGKNILSLNLPDILFQNITFSYERFVGEKGKLGLRVPFSISLYGDNNNNFNFGSYNIFYTGLDLNFYPTGQGQARLFIGPSLRSGYARVSNSVFNDFFNETSIQNSGYFSFLIQSGVLWTPIKEITVSSSFGLGSRRYFTAAPGAGNLTRTTANFNFSIGYRF